jgi:hypothetical protein
MTLLESSPAASALLQLVAEELLRNKRKGLCFPISHGLLWWSSTTTTDPRADVAELHHICPRSALAASHSVRKLRWSSTAVCCCSQQSLLLKSSSATGIADSWCCVAAELCRNANAPLYLQA